MGHAFHPFWLLALMFVFSPVAVLVAIIAIVQTRASRPPANYGLLSPDGRWWWDGRQWQPVPPSNGDR